MHEQRTGHPSPGQAPRHTYFVGRRQFEATEIFAVTADDVQRLRSERRYGERILDWHGNVRAGMELSHALLTKVAELRPTRDLEERFALYVLAHLPDDGFVLDSAEVWRWLRVASDPQDFEAHEPTRHVWTARLRTLFRGGEPQHAHG
jgi:hypothetical protein